ncbi:cation acetate symporter [Streptomyces sp. NPDC059169]|uniref:sodium/solute symporter n=1 Tax=unclassified Streptomyces TaxID=2593676 RepID=UPI0036CB64D5
MPLEFLSTGALDSIGSDARRPVIIAFLLFVSGSLLWLFALVAAHQDDPDRLYVAGRRLSPTVNGFAMAGEQISAVALLAIPGGIALFGYDGFTVAVDVLLTMGVMLLLAQRTRNTGRYTLGELFALRAPGPGPRIAAALVTLAITLPVLTVQLRAAGISVSLLIGMPTDSAQLICTILIGFLVACFAAIGDLRGITFMQVVKVPLCLITLAVVTLLALRRFEWNPGHLLGAAVNRSLAPDKYLSPGLWPYWTSLRPLNSVGEHIIAILGTAVAPHLLLRIGASRSGPAARRSISIASALVGMFTVLLIATGFASAALLGSKNIGAADGNGQSSLLLLASDVLDDGSSARVALITTIACVTFLAVFTAVTSVAFAAAVSLTRDVFARRLRRHSNTAEVRTLRLAVVLLCTAGLSLSVATHHYQVEFLVNFALNVAASCIFPALICSLFWQKFNRRGLLWSVYCGLALCTLLTIFSPEVSGTTYALWPETDFAWYPFHTPGLISVPAAFLLGWTGSITSHKATPSRFPDTEHTTPTDTGERPTATSADYS